MNNHTSVNAIRPATKAEAKPLIGLYAESGNGKTWSALLLARGFVGPAGEICMIETEGGRGEANVGREPVGQYLVRPIRGDFSPQEYGRAISDVEAANVDALIIDSASHEWDGVNGVLAQAADNQAAGKKGVLVWQQPKINHQRHFMLRLMQTPIPLVIVCMRAKYPMEQVKSDWVRSKVLEPKQADDILFEMFVHGWIDQQHVLHVTKYTLPELADIIRDGEPISIESGRRLATWAKGGTASPSPRRNPAPVSDAADPAPGHHPPDTQPGAGNPSDDRLAEMAAAETRLRNAAEGGWDELKREWQRLPKWMRDDASMVAEREKLKVRAAEVDAAEKELPR